MSKEIQLTEANFDAEVLKSNVPVLVDFWAEWCGPCRMMNPIVEELAVSYEGRLKVGKVNVDESPNLSAQYGIQGVPSFLVFQKGELVKQMVGAQPADKLKSQLDPLL